MRPLRKGAPTVVEEWNVQEVMKELDLDEMKAEELLKVIRQLHNVTGYGPLPKEWVMDYVAEKERVQREREARYQADISTTESLAILKEQVRTLKESCISSSADARKARCHSLVSNVISAVSLGLALFAFILGLLK